MYNILKRLKTRKGHGVHSPFVYKLLINVIHTKSRYYKIEILDKKYKKEMKYKRKLLLYYHLLFRLSVYFKWKTILYVGKKPLLPLLYLTEYDINNTIAYYYDHLEKSEYKRYNNKIFPFFNKEIENKIDLFIISKDNQNLSIEKIYEELKGKLSENGIVLIEGINKKGKNKYLWEETIVKEMNLTIDLYHFGMAFHNNKYIKKQYFSYFN